MISTSEMQRILNTDYCPEIFDNLNDAAALMKIIKAAVVLSVLAEGFRKGTKKNFDFISRSFCGMDGTRTRDPMRDRHVF